MPCCQFGGSNAVLCCEKCSFLGQCSLVGFVLCLLSLMRPLADCLDALRLTMKSWMHVEIYSLSIDHPLRRLACGNERYIL